VSPFSLGRRVGDEGTQPADRRAFSCLRAEYPALFPRTAPQTGAAGPGQDGVIPSGKEATMKPGDVTEFFFAGAGLDAGPAHLAGRPRLAVIVLVG